MSNKPPRRNIISSARRTAQSLPASSAIRELFSSLSKEQSSSQELLASMAFALRSFTNLHRFLELVPVVASRLLGVKGSLLVPFHSDGRILHDQLHLVPLGSTPELLR